MFVLMMRIICLYNNQKMKKTCSKDDDDDDGIRNLLESIHIGIKNMILGVNVCLFNCGPLLYHSHKVNDFMINWFWLVLCVSKYKCKKCLLGFNANHYELCVYFVREWVDNDAVSDLKSNVIFFYPAHRWLHNCCYCFY